MSDKTTIEINGVKMEVDLRHARRIEEMHIGDRVKVLTKDYSGHRVNSGTIVGFEPFNALPTIVIAYVELTYQKAEIKFRYFNSESKDTEIVAAADDIETDRETILALFDRQLAAKQREMDEITDQRRYFETNFRAYWERLERPHTAGTAEVEF